MKVPKLLFNVKWNRIVLCGGGSKLLLVVLVGFRIRSRVPVRYVGQVGYALQHGGRGRWRS